MQDRDILLFVVDLMKSLIRGCFFAGMFTVLQRYRYHSKGGRKLTWLILLLQYMAVRMSVWWVPPVRCLIYGSSTQITDSRQSIVFLAVCIFLSFLCVILLYKEKALLLLYLTVTFYALEELTRFMLYIIWDVFSTAFFEWLYRITIEMVTEPEWYRQIISFAADILLILLEAAFIAMFYVVYRAFRQRLRDKKELPAGQELYFLILPGIIALCVGTLIRGTMYRIEGTQVYSLLDSNPEMRAIIPLLTVGCMLSIFQSLGMLIRLDAQNEEKRNLLVYRQRAEDLEEHIRDIEHLYDGIRSVKHDIKNYAIDMEELLQSKDMVKTDIKQELREYLDGLYESMEQLDMRFATGNAVTDVVINRYLREAQRIGIRTECSFLFPKNLGINAFDMAVILNNAFSNALEACKKEPESSRSLKLSGRQRGNFYILEMENSFSGVLKHEAGSELPGTIKDNPSEHGIGMKNMRKCAQRYLGGLHWEAGGGRFLLRIMLQNNNS